MYPQQLLPHNHHCSWLSFSNSLIGQAVGPTPLILRLRAVCEVLPASSHLHVHAFSVHIIGVGLAHPRRHCHMQETVMEKAIGIRFARPSSQVCDVSVKLISSSWDSPR